MKIFAGFLLTLVILIGAVGSAKAQVSPAPPIPEPSPAPTTPPTIIPTPGGLPTSITIENYTAVSNATQNCVVMVNVLRDAEAIDQPTTDFLLNGCYLGIANWTACGYTVDAERARRIQAELR